MLHPGPGPLCGGRDVGGTSRMTCSFAKLQVLVQPSCSEAWAGWRSLWSFSAGLPPARILAGIKQGNCPGGLWSGWGTEDVSRVLSVLLIALGCRSHCLPCKYDNSWISWEFFTALPKHLNVNLRCLLSVRGGLKKLGQNLCYAVVKV